MMTEFPLHLLPYVRSPHSGLPLSLCKGTPSSTGGVAEGTVMDINDNRYRIQKGILQLLSTEELSPLEDKERVQRDEEAARYDRRLAARHFREVRPFVRTLNIESSDTVLELAAGTGRMTKELAGKVSALIVTDFSFESLVTAAKALPALPSIGLVQADSVSFPGSPSTFSLVYSAQFIEHIPTPARRAAHVASMKRLLLPLGRVVLSAYHHDIRRARAGLAQEGTHPNGIFFHYFTSSELLSLFSNNFSRVSISYLDVIPPGAARFIHSERLLGVLSWVCVHTPLKVFAHLIVVSARNDAPA